MFQTLAACVRRMKIFLLLIIFDARLYSSGFRAPCAPVEYASTLGLGPGLRQVYKMNFQPRVGFAYRPFGNNKTVVRGGFGIFTMARRHRFMLSALYGVPVGKNRKA
jgi:hypothetical protein